MTGDEGRCDPALANGANPTADVTAPAVAGEPFTAESPPAPGSLGRFNLHGEWADILTPHGWTVDATEEGRTRWYRTKADGPGGHYGWTLHEPEDDGWDALVLNAKRPPLPFKPGDAFGKFAVYTLLNFGGLTAAAFRAAARALRDLGYAEDDGTAAAEARAVTGEEPESVDSWAPVNLTPFMDGSVPPVEPSVGIARDDGLRLIYPGKEHGVNGEMESGKSWFCLACSAAELLAGNHVVYMHFEESHPGDTVERLLALGVPAEVLTRLFRFVAPDRPVTDDDLGALLDPVPTLVVLDGVNEGMALHGHAIRAEDGAAAFRRLLVKPFTKVGAATLAADHVVKDVEHRGRYALGSVHKGNALSGSLLLLENVERFGRGVCGRSRVYMVKDRSGHLGQHGRPGKSRTLMGELIVDAIDPAGLGLTFSAVSTGEATGEQIDPQRAHLTKVDGHVLGVVETLAKKGGPVSGRAVRAVRPGYSTDATADALQRLVDAGVLTETAGPNRTKLFALSGPEAVEIKTPEQAPRVDLWGGPTKGATPSGPPAAVDLGPPEVHPGPPLNNVNVNDIDKDNNRPSALTAVPQRTAVRVPAGDHDRSAAR